LHKSPISYRPEIDGLRAVAVLPVILFHAGVSGFSGGFVGVDIFFVISGYLIGAILMQDIARGQFSVSRFYGRRVRRILPALAFVCAVTSLAAAALLPAAAFGEYARSLVGVATFTSNIFFWWHTDYFAQEAELRPLLHTWSLAVEEQYYVIFPLLLAALWRGGRTKTLPVVLGALAAASLIAAEYMSRMHPSAAFFLLPTRFWELLAGAGAALWLRRTTPPADALPRLVREGLSMAALAAILIAIHWFDGRTRTPGLPTLLPVLGAVGIILFATRGTLVARLLSWRPVVFVGLISYSAYLWHQPLFALTRETLVAAPSTALMLGLSALALLLATLTWRFVERPFRDIDNTAGLLRGGLATLLLMALAGPVLGAAYDRLGFKRATFDAARIAAGREERFVIRNKVCNARSWDRCDQPVPGAVNALVIGDSIAIDIYNLIYLAAGDRVALSMSSLPGCPMAPAADLDGRLSAQHPDRAACLELNRNRYDPEWLAQFDVVAVTALFSWYDEADMVRLLDWLGENYHGKVVVLGGAFIFRKDLPELMNAGADPSGWIARDPRATEAAVAAAAAAHGALYLGEGAAFCPGGHCRFTDDAGTPSTWDREHLSMAGIDRLLTAFGDRLRAFLS